MREICSGKEICSGVNVFRRKFVQEKICSGENLFRKRDFFRREIFPGERFVQEKGFVQESNLFRRKLS